MTDTRLPESYLMDRRLIRLEDRQFRVYVMTMIWSVSNRTDGVIDAEDLGFLHMQDGDAKRFSDLGLWRPVDGGWAITDFERTQTSRHDLEVLERARKSDREAKARKRAHQSGDHSRCYPSVCELADVQSEGASGGRVPRTAQEGQAGRKAGNNRPAEVTFEAQPATSSAPLNPRQRSAAESWSTGKGVA